MQIIDFIYKKEQFSEEKFEKVIVYYLDTNGQQLHPKDEYEGIVGKWFWNDPLASEGYRLLKMIGNRWGVYPDGEHYITHVYEKFTIDNPDLIGTLCVIYRDTEGNHLAPNFEEQGIVGTSYTLSYKEIPGYKLYEILGNSIDRFKIGIQTLEVVYQKIDTPVSVQGIVTTTFKNEENMEISERVTQKGKIGESYHTQAKKFPL